jgi:hypothetical protein
MCTQADTDESSGLDVDELKAFSEFYAAYD